MKQLIAILTCFLSLQAFATDYFVKTGGNDALTGLDDTNAWGSLSKVSTVFSSLSAGDVIYLKRGDTFTGSIIVNKSGNSLNPIVISAYGTGAMPVITGFITVTGWTNIGGNLWESAAIGGTNSAHLVTINGVMVGRGRWPNYGWRTYPFHSGSTSISDATLTNSPNWTGAILQMKPNHDYITNDTITSHLDTTITFKRSTTYSPQNGYGYAIVNSLLTLDTAGEWFFDKTTRKFTVYSLTTPTNFKTSIVDTLIYIGAFDYITINNIDFQGSNVGAVVYGSLVGQSTNVIIQNSNFNYSGRNAIYCTNALNSKVNNNAINNSLNTAFYGENEGGQTNGTTITNNIIRNTGTIPGMGFVDFARSQNVVYNGITFFGPNATISNNTIDTVGHCGIAWYYSNISCKYNKVNYSNFVTDDGGGINVFDNTFGDSVNTNREIISNIVTNVIGIAAGTADNKTVANGIYLDDLSKNVIVDSNSVANIANVGIYYHNVDDITARANNVYKCGDAALKIVHDNHATGNPIRGLIFKKNKCFQIGRKQNFVELWTIRNDLDSIMTVIDSNLYARPDHPTDTTFRFQSFTTGYNNLYRTFTTYKSMFASAAFGAYDPHSIEKPANGNASRFEYNATASPVVLSLGAIYKDLDDVAYNGSVTIPAYSSITLMYSSPLIASPSDGFMLKYRKTTFIKQ